MKKTGFRKICRHIIRRYRNLPADLCSQRISQRSRAQKLLTLTLCIPIMLYCLGYIVHWEYTRKSILQNNEAYSALYVPPTELPTIPPTATPAPTASPMPTPEPTHASTPEPEITSSPSPEATLTIAPSPSATPTPAPTATPIPQDTPLPFEIAVDATLTPLATPDADTIIMALETPPPVQESFKELLALNSETVGFLQIGDFLALPVVQRINDSEFYLDHDFSGEESIAGTLFLDGSNLLVPEDPNLIIYGHNMRNGTMFHSLIQYDQLPFLKENPVVRFDTIYQNRNYVPFAVFTVTAEPDSERYLDIRRFLFEENDWNNFIIEMRRLSIHNIPVDVRYGDHILLLVTCEYTHNNGRFVIALRAQREGEKLEDLKAHIRNAR